jgi:hypothetical protein
MAASKKRLSKKALTAATASKHVLYEASVQDVSADRSFIERVYRKEHGQQPTVLREDFCGTAQLCAEWVKSKDPRKAIGVDLHNPTLVWGHATHIMPLGKDAAKVTLLCQNVLDKTPKADVTAAFNFSYCVFKTRAMLLQYVSGVRACLNKGGALMMDIHGGTEACEETIETKKLKGFTYVWEQCPVDAIAGTGVRHIHFRFPDGSEMRKAFTYDWRIWNLPEVTDVLYDAGFKRVDVYWEGDDGKGGGNGVFRKAARAENQASWIAYIVAWK